MKRICDEIGVKIYCFFVSFIFLMFASANSFIYPLNTQPDPNAFMMIGKRMLGGEIMYKDFYEHKGPYLCIVMAFVCLISTTTFIGMFWVEVIIYSIFLWYSYKISKMYIDNGVVLLPVIMMLCVAFPMYTQEIAAEELCLPFIILSLYLILKYYFDEKKSVWFINGICTGIIFWIKYTILAVYVIWCFIILINCLKNRKYKYLFDIVFFWFIGIAVSMIPIAIYFSYNNAWYDLFVAYFYNPIFVYGKSTYWWASIARFFVHLTKLWPVMVLHLAGCFVILKSNRNKFNKLVVVLPIIVLYIFIISNAVAYIYTWQVSEAFFVVYLCVLLDRLKVVKEFRVKYIVFVFLVCFVFTLGWCKQSKYLNYKYELYPAVELSDVIEKKKDYEIVFYRAADPGVSMKLGYINDMKYFNFYNIWTNEIDEEYEKKMNEDKPDYVITKSGDYHNDNVRYLKSKGYHIVKKTRQELNSLFWFYLWERED